MKRVPMPLSNQPIHHTTTSTLNGDASDKGMCKEIDTLTDARQAPFEDRFRTLSKPFQYMLKVNGKEKNITNTIWATELAEEIQYIIICEIKQTKPAAQTRDSIIVSNTKYMTQIFEQILNLFESPDYDVKYDIGGLFELLIGSIYRLESTITPTFYESIKFNDTRKILREYKDWVIELRSKFIL